MEAKTIKISAENYQLLRRYAGELQQETGELVSVDKALSFIFRKGKLSDLAGSWKMTTKQAEEMFAGLRKGWKGWKIPSV